MNLSRRDLAAAGVLALGVAVFASPVLADTEDEAAVKKAVEKLKGDGTFGSRKPSWRAKSPIPRSPSCKSGRSRTAAGSSWRAPRTGCRSRRRGDGFSAQARQAAIRIVLADAVASNQPCRSGVEKSSRIVCLMMSYQLVSDYSDSKSVAPNPPVAFAHLH